MSEYKKMKFWIGDDPDLSERVQKLLFGLGYKWRGAADQRVRYTEVGALYTNEDGYILYTDADAEWFNNESQEEIDIDWMRSQKPETIELNGKKYIKSELEEAIKRIKPVEE